jgi:hypothetical protein
LVVKNGSSQRSRLVAAALVAAVLLCGCRKPKQEEVASVPELGYPTCPEGDAGPGEHVMHGDLRGQAESMSEGAAREVFDLWERGCLRVFTARQEWALGATDVEVVFDDQLRPLRAWRRMTLPRSERADGNADVRRYELRTEEVTMKQRNAQGVVRFAKIKGKRPTAVVGPGHGLVSVWIRRAQLKVGEKVREPVLDFREMQEVVRDVTLKREPDIFEPSLQRTVQVYTIYGREAVFVDENGVVVGDLAGLRPTATVATPLPAPLPLFGAPDPVGTP